MPSSNGLVLKRHAAGPSLWRGTLTWNGAFLADTLEWDSTQAAEVATGHIPRLAAGSYTVSLDTASSWNASYGFGMGEFHQGMLAIKPVDSTYTYYFRIGDKPAESLGHVLLGTATETGLKDSNSVYKKVYQTLVAPLNQGTALTLLIVEA